MKKRILLVVGSADSIFTYNLAKFLKKERDCIIDVFELFPLDTPVYRRDYYDRVYSIKTASNKSLFVRYMPFFRISVALSSFLEEQFYDVISCHWLVSCSILVNNYKRHCNRLVATFWGGEFETQSILNSKWLYRIFLKRFLRSVDVTANSNITNHSLESRYSFLNGKTTYASFGSTSLEAYYSLKEKESKQESKRKLNIDSNKIVVLIGYSGKNLHNHIPIIDSITKSAISKNKICLLAPMTRDASPDYADKVYSTLQDSGIEFCMPRNKYLTDEEVASMRNATDVVMQLSDFDDFSRSVIESLCASVVIYADWLNYDIKMAEYGFKAIKCNAFDDAATKLKYYVDNQESFESFIMHNIIIGKQFLWSNCINYWTKAFGL